AEAPGTHQGGWREAPGVSSSCRFTGTHCVVRVAKGGGLGVGGSPPLGSPPGQPLLQFLLSSLPSRPQQQVQPWSSVHRLFCPGGSAPGWPGHHRLLPVPAAGPAGQADGHLSELAAGEPADEASQACVPHPHSSPSALEPWPLPCWGGRLGPSSLGTGHTHAAPPAPTASKPLSKMRVSAPMLMQALPMEGPEPMRNATKYGNMTQDHVMHLLLKSDPLGVYPKLKGSLPENLKHLKNTMDGVNWKLFENWLRQWLLFEMSKNSLEETPFEVPPKDPLETEDLSSGLGVTKQDLGQVIL
uniref:CD74 molecule n=1 Tax=Sus scrofa TaxID=9823 RepID=A0A8D0W6B8_PIG